jgi:hypothetical protein
MGLVFAALAAVTKKTVSFPAKADSKYLPQQISQSGPPGQGRFVAGTA